MTARPRRRRGLSAGDDALFRRAMSDVRPLSRKDDSVTDIPEMPAPPSEEATLPVSWLAAGTQRPQVRIEHPALDKGGPFAARTDVSPRDQIDPRARRKLAKGRQSIDRTIDLHGLGQEDAFKVLVRTIERAVQRNMKTVLVITGKGGRRFRQQGDTPAAYRRRRDFSPEGGVLRRMVPLWLSGEALGPLVESYGSAAQGHGGDGALYVRLRRKRGPRTNA